MVIAFEIVETFPLVGRDDIPDVLLGMDVTDTCRRDTLQNLIAGAMENTQNRYNAFMNQLQSSLDVIVTNRNQLNPEEQPAAAEPEKEDDGFDIDIALDNK